jgi:hypothetical protein
LEKEKKEKEQIFEEKIQTFLKKISGNDTRFSLIFKKLSLINKNFLLNITIKHIKI